MFDISLDDSGNVVVSGRLDASTAPQAQQFLDQTENGCTIDMLALEYISSAGLGVLLKTHKRLMGAGLGLKLINVSAPINAIFGYSGFDHFFDIRLAP